MPQCSRKRVGGSNLESCIAGVATCLRLCVLCVCARPSPEWDTGPGNRTWGGRGPSWTRGLCDQEDGEKEEEERWSKVEGLVGSPPEGAMFVSGGQDRLPHGLC